MDLFGEDVFYFKEVSEEEVVVHCFGDDFGDGKGGEFDEGVVLGGAGGFVAGEAEAGDGAELGEVGAHLGFVEAVGDAPDVEISIEVSLPAFRSQGEMIFTQRR